MSTRYRTAFFDAGGVLVSPNWSRASETLARHGVVVDAAALAAAEPGVKKRLDVPHAVAGTTDEQRGFLFFDLILKGAGVPISASTDEALRELKVFHDVENTWDVVTEGAPEILRRVRQAGLKTIVVSNSNGRIKHLFGRVGLIEHFDLVLDSQEEGVEKPDPRLFQIALERSGSDPKATIHCGDLYEIDIVGARAAGLPAVLLDEAGMYGHVTDCPRVRTLAEYADGLLAGRFD
jgi:HAD superfamily hydrolase (TIGR01509 family)